MKSASLGPDAIVYEQFGEISLYDLKSGKTKPVTIHVPAICPSCAAARERRTRARIAGGFAERRARGLRGSRRDHHGSRGERRCAQSDQYAGRDGARSALVARRQDASRIFPTNRASMRCTCGRRPAPGE